MESINNPESFLDKTIREMAEKGFEFVGGEHLGRDRFDSATAKFLPVVEQTESEIIQRYSKGGKFEIELVQMPDDKIQDMLSKGIVTEEEASHLVTPEAERSFLVFRR